VKVTEQGACELQPHLQTQLSKAFGFGVGVGE
jgi:hypothetical protein